MSPDALKVLKALNEFGSVFEPCYFSFRPLTVRTGLDRRTVRRNARYLKRKGLAEFYAGLFTEDGEVAGAGYAITEAGREFLERERMT